MKWTRNNGTQTSFRKIMCTGGTQRLADVQERIWWLKEDLANRVDELCGKKNLVVFYTRNLEYEKSKLNKRIEEEQIGISRDRKNLEEEWKKKS